MVVQCDAIVHPCERISSVQECSFSETKVEFLARESANWAVLSAAGTPLMIPFQSYNNKISVLKNFNKPLGPSFCYSILLLHHLIFLHQNCQLVSQQRAQEVILESGQGMNKQRRYKPVKCVFEPSMYFIDLGPRTYTDIVQTPGRSGKLRASLSAATTSPPKEQSMTTYICLEMANIEQSNHVKILLKK